MFGTGRKNELLGILKNELEKYEILENRKKTDVKRVAGVIISFIKHIIWLVEAYYARDFKKSNNGKVFQRDAGKLDRHISSIIHIGRGCKLNTVKIDNFWKGNNIGRIDAKKMSEDDVVNFVNKMRRLLGYLYRELRKI
ncbi:hypothetical protein CL621_01805 [archaeon]|nr:hypothetical protein [archaeon]